MDAATLLVLGLIAAFAVFYATAFGGSIDALAQPREAWERAGFRRSRWVWQAFGVLFLPGMLAYSGTYFARVRPRLVAAARDLAIEQGAARACLLPMAESAGPHLDQVRIRIPLSVASAIALPGVLGGGIGFGLATLSAGSGAPPHWGPFVVYVFTGLLVAAAGNLAFGVKLTPHDLVMQGLIRRHVAWSDVVAITQESRLGSRYVRLWTRTARGRRLRAPFTMLGVGRRRFDVDFAALEQWWLAHIPATD